MESIKLPELGMLGNDARCNAGTKSAYYQREGWEETRRRYSWGYRRLSVRIKKIARRLTYDDETLTRLPKEAIQQACPKD